jgi:4-amino-4-deoxy-L-arabinose transferase-like glycosyltransferase
LQVAATGAAVLVVVAAVALRLHGLGDVAPDPFYDAAVRSMGTSWHDFLFGALEPGGSVAIDKPAVALWPQVLSTRVLGFSTFALLLPSALAGLAGVALLQRLAALVWGRAAGWAAAAALAVVPLAVLTDRSDTMDTLAVALALLSAVALVAAARAEAGDASRGRWLIAGAGAAVGAAFAVKLFQALIPVPALAVLYVAASPLALGERLSRLVLWSAVATAVGLSWFLVVSTAPVREQPWAYGSHDGTAISAAFAYDGLDRLAGPLGQTARVSSARRAGADLAAAAPAPPGPLRLVSSHADLRGLFGVELIPALVVGGLAILLGWRAARLPRAGALFLATWLLTGVAVLSFMPDLKVRYVDVLAPPAAAALGAGLVALTARKPIGVLLLAALLAAPTVQAVRVVQRDASDSGHLGALTPHQAGDLSAFLAPRTRHTRYELASATAAKAAPLIEDDARPVLMLGTMVGQELTSLKRFRKDVARGEVRYVLMGGHCGPHSALRPGGCGRAARWAKVHGRDVSHRAHLRAGTLYALIPASARDAINGSGHARRFALDPHRRRRVDAARNPHPIVPARGARHARGR